MTNGLQKRARPVAETLDCFVNAIVSQRRGAGTALRAVNGWLREVERPSRGAVD